MKTYRIYLATGEYFGRYLFNVHLLADAFGGYGKFTVKGDVIRLK